MIGVGTRMRDDDLVDVTVDGVLRERPSTPVARSLLEEAR